MERRGRDFVPLGPSIIALLMAVKPLIFKASVELCSAGAGGPAWRRPRGCVWLRVAACVCVLLTRPHVQGWGEGLGCCDSSDTEPRMSRVLLSPGKDSSQLVPGLQVTRRRGMASHAFFTDSFC